MTVLPEFRFEIFAGAIDAREAGAFNSQDHGSSLQVAVFPIEMIAGSGVADEGAVDGGGCGEDFAGWQIGPITRTDKAAGFYPVETAIEMSGEARAGFGFYSERLRAEHAFAELVAETVNHAVVGAHALLHDFWRDADHVGVADLAAFDDAHDSHARTELTGLRRHAHSANVGGFEGLQDVGGRGGHGARAELFQEKAGVLRAAVFDGGGNAGGYGAAGFVGDESDVLAGADSEASFHGVLCAGH